MSTITFFRQERADGGIRCGVDCDGQTVLERFLKGPGEDNSALLWYVDVAIEGDDLPTDEPEAAREWLIEHEADIAPALLKVAGELEVGVDILTPLQRPLPDLIKEARVSILANGVRRVNAMQIGGRIREIGLGWSNMLRELAPLIPA